ncbi:TPA: hypothetical protein ACPQXA_001063 [Streptococcus mutans]|uniref:hypothetical protein n=1 Tax=Streptococcus mutans TaxID=1309 RepID=UPI0002B4F6A1|nr:hypothetical protein [Streptococcus mutans]AVM70643.1 hypothetical protein CO204_00455 [Streptococcus mutans]EMC21584.1 hypothetical protein SMU80_02280 [Streptococcus mutans SF1]EMC23097.1 hypothetical protein SMU81_04959 [Streptococcus mutans SF14]EMC42422.1 hypothetical protein SMU97_06617 [Streptococcus mutans SM4]EMC50297.1 hypothetical protein SMU102_05084 [Streptococcus mutans S1B]
MKKVKNMSSALPTVKRTTAIFPDVVKVSVACATETRGFFGTSVSKISDEIPKGVAHIPTTKGNSKKEKYLKRN